MLLGRRDNFYSMCVDVDLFHRNVYEFVNLKPFALWGQAEGKWRACVSLNELTNLTSKFSEAAEDKRGFKFEGICNSLSMSMSIPIEFSF